MSYVLSLGCLTKRTRTDRFLNEMGLPRKMDTNSGALMGVVFLFSNATGER